MFGYVRPASPELRVRELEMWKALYCGICHTLGTRYGISARFILSYDFVFLCSLLWPEDETPRIEQRRCPVSVRKKRCVCNDNPATRRAAGYGVILAYHKLRDNAEDERLLGAVLARCAMAGLSRAYKKARRDFPEYDAAARLHLEALARLEKGSDAPPDAFADEFARLLAEAARSEEDESRRRVFESLLYHLGRWLYYIDARDDLREDTEKNKPNPLRGGAIDDAALEVTMRHSNNLASGAFELLPETAWSEINRNVLYLGLPAVLADVFEGRYTPDSGYRSI